MTLGALLNNWDSSLPATFGYSHLDADVRMNITRSVNEFYFDNENTPTLQVNRQQLMNVRQKFVVIATPEHRNLKSDC